MNSLNDTQKEFLTHFLRRGKRTAFSNVLAKEKAGASAEDDIAAHWELTHYIDAGPFWRTTSELFCECGRMLRYQYVVKNVKTGDIKKFGWTHFEDHTGIPPYLAKQILKGFEEIDYELDEILIKISTDWTLSKEGLDTLPEGIHISADIQAHFTHEVPLLTRQVERLKARMNRFIKQKKAQEQVDYKRGELKEIKLLINEIEHTQWWEMLGSTSELSTVLKIATVAYLKRTKHNQLKASDVCEHLVTYHHAPTKTYSSGTYQIFPIVCLFLEELADMGRVVLLEKMNGFDRKYELVDPFLKNDTV